MTKWTREHEAEFQRLSAMRPAEKPKLPSEWAKENVYVVEGGRHGRTLYTPKPGDHFDTYADGEKVDAVCEAYNGKTIRFNYIRHNPDHTREVKVQTYYVRFGR